MKMKGDYFDVCSFDSIYGLVIRNNESFEGVVESIQDVVDRAKAAGYDNDEKWLIVKIEWEKDFDEKGIFQKETVMRTTVGIYDNGKVTRI